MPRRSVSWPAVALALSLSWLALLAAAPVVRAGPRDWPEPARVAAALVYVTGSFVCHQRPERSFQLGGAPMPVCARCVGLYGGASLGLLAAVVAPSIGRRRTRPAAPVWLLLAALPTVFSVALEWLGVASPMWIRTLAAVSLGAGVATLIGAWLGDR